MRHAHIASQLLILGGALACGPLLAQTPPATDEPGQATPTASVTLVVPAEPEQESRPDTAVQPTASVTLVQPSPPATTIATGVPTTVATGVPTTVATGVPTTVATGVPTTVATGVPTTVATGVPTTIATGVPTTIATGVPTTVATGVPTTVATGVPTTVATGVPTSTTSGLPAATPPGTVPAAAAVLPATGTVTPATGGVIDPATYQKRTEFDNTPWRFNMEQNGRRMTADEFTAWMEARGVRVARGPAAHRPVDPTTDGMPAPGSARPAGVEAPVQALVPAAASSVAPAPVAPAVEASPAADGLPVTTTVLTASPTASATVVGPPPADGLAPGSVTPTDAWSDVEPTPEPTSSATIVVPAEPAPEAVPPTEGAQAH